MTELIKMNLSDLSGGSAAGSDVGDAAVGFTSTFPGATIIHIIYIMCCLASFTSTFASVSSPSLVVSFGPWLPLSKSSVLWGWHYMRGNCRAGAVN